MVSIWWKAAKISPFEIFIVYPVPVTFISHFTISHPFCPPSASSLTARPSPHPGPLTASSRKEKSLTCNRDVNSGIDEYTRLHSSESATERNAEYANLVNSYYDLATLFYEWGWGQSFHFAYRHPHESFAESIRRHEYYLASKLNLAGARKSSPNCAEGVRGNNRPKVLDVGCGVGGPMRNVTRFTGADITGITLNRYQVERGNQLSSSDPQLGLDKCRSVQGDFMKQPFEDSSFDAAYAIEATCHAPDRTKCYAEIYRTLRPGSIFACYEWCMTDLYDPTNPEHRKIKKQIEEGDGLPDICHTSQCLDSLKEAGFEILEERDMCLDDYGQSQGGKPWMLPLLPSWNPFTQRFQFNPLGFFLTNNVLKLLELLRLAPRGTCKTQSMLQTGGFGLGDGGKLGIFTPMYLMVGRVPLDKTQ